jgi:hypothetical protein
MAGFDLRNVHKLGKQLEDHGKQIQRLVEQTLTGKYSYSAKMWKHDLKNNVADAEREIKILKEFIAKMEEMEKESSTKET